MGGGGMQNQYKPLIIEDLWQRETEHAHVAGHTSLLNPQAVSSISPSGPNIAGLFPTDQLNNLVAI